MTAVTACLCGCTLSRTLYWLLPAACYLLLLLLLLLLPLPLRTHHSCTFPLHPGGVTNCTLLSGRGDGSNDPPCTMKILLQLERLASDRPTSRLHSCTHQTCIGCRCCGRSSLAPPEL